MKELFDKTNECLTNYDLALDVMREFRILGKKLKCSFLYSKFSEVNAAEQIHSQFNPQAWVGLQQR